MSDDMGKLFERAIRSEEAREAALGTLEAMGRDRGDVAIPCLISSFARTVEMAQGTREARESFLIASLTRAHATLAGSPFGEAILTGICHSYLAACLHAGRIPRAETSVLDAIRAIAWSDADWDEDTTHERAGEGGDD